MDENKIREVALEAVMGAGAALRDHFTSGDRSYELKGERDILSEADLAAEQIILDRIRGTFPDHSILSEESGETMTGSPYEWIIDPMDGTINFSRGIADFCVSIGVSKDSVLELGIVYEPIRDRLFVAERGKGATLNGDPIRVSGESALASTLLAVDNSSKMPERVRILRLLAEISPSVRHVRIYGSAALHMTRIAAGEIDAYFKTTCNYWDHAAGTLLVEEVGGTVTDLEGRPLSADSTSIAISNGLVHEELLQTLTRMRSLIIE